jgi:hypothetical protein
VLVKAESVLGLVEDRATRRAVGRAVVAAARLVGSLLAEGLVVVRLSAAADIVSMGCR